MRKTFALFASIIFCFALGFPAFSQPDMGGPTQDYDNIDANYIEDIFYWPQQGEYIIICRHDFYQGPSGGPPFANSSAEHTKFLMGLVRTTGESYIKIDATPEWVRLNLAASQLKVVEFIDTDYVSGTGVIWDIGPHRITEATVKGLPLVERFYDGFMGDIVYVEGYSNANGIAGYFDHTDQKPGLFKPDPSMNYWELNKEGMNRYDTKKYAEAVEFFLKSLAINPDFQHSNYNLACMFSLLGKPFSEGKPYLEKLFSNPDLKAYYLRKIPTDTDFNYWRTLKEFRDWFSAQQR